MVSGEQIEQANKTLGNIGSDILNNPLGTPFDEEARKKAEEARNNPVGTFFGNIGNWFKDRYKDAGNIAANLGQTVQQAPEIAALLTDAQNQKAWREPPSEEEKKLLADYKKQKAFQELQSNGTLQTLATGMNLANLPAGEVPEGAGLDRVTTILHKHTNDLLDTGGQLKAAFSHVMKKVGDAWQQGGNIMEKIQGVFTAVTSTVQGFMNGDFKHDLLKERVDDIYDELREKGFSKDFSTKIAEGAYKTGAEKADVPADKLLDIKQVVDKPKQATNILAAGTGGRIDGGNGVLSTLENKNLSTPQEVNPLASLMNGRLPSIEGITASLAPALPMVSDTITNKPVSQQNTVASK